MVYQVQLRSDSALFADLAAEWSSLLRRSVVDSLFLTPEWQQVWWQHFSAGRDLFVLLARDPDGTLQGIAPLCAFDDAGRRILQFVGGVDVSDYLDLIVAREQEEEVYRAFVNYLLTEAPPWDQLDLHSLPGHSPTRAGLLCQVCQECGPGETVAEPEDAAPYIPLSGDWETYLATLDKKQRHEIRRKLRRAQEEAELRMSRLQDPAGLEEEVGIFVQLHRASHPEKEAFMTADMEAFFRDVARVTLASGWLSLYTLRFDGRPAAAMWCFDYRNDLLVYNSGYDPTWRPELSPGIVLMSLCIQDAIARGKARFDLMRGGETYKYRFGALDSAVYRLQVRRPGPP